jgi:nitroreductase
MKSQNAKLLDLFFARKSIRKFKSKRVSESVVRRIVDVGQRAPSACNLQTYTIVWVRDAQKKRQVWDACDVPKGIRGAPVVFVICADVRRLARVLDYSGSDHCLRHGYGVQLKIMSVVDASLMAENMVMAAECLGLGSVFIGSALANSEVIGVLKLPKGVLPLTLLCVGYADEAPPVRPRWALSSMMLVDQYRDQSNTEMKKFLGHMTNELAGQGYYKNYSRIKASYGYRDHIQGKTNLKSNKKNDAETLNGLKATGYLPNEAIAT